MTEVTVTKTTTMADQPSPTPPSPAPPSKLQNIEAIILAALKGLSLLPGVGAPAAIAEVFANILVAAQNTYTQESGAPLDLSQIPFEAQVP